MRIDRVLDHDNRRTPGNRKKHGTASVAPWENPLSLENATTVIDGCVIDGM
jgi:hypothetical protein